MRRVPIGWVVMTLLATVLPRGVRAQGPVRCQEEYTVQRGDWLSRISERFFGDVQAYAALQKINSDDPRDAYHDIENPDRIEPGWILCIPSREDMAEIMASIGRRAPDGLTSLDLMNASYRGIQADAVTLVRGRYEGEPFVEGGASRPIVSLIQQPIAYGDLTGDGQPDAVVHLAEDSGGSGTFVYLALVVSEAGRPVNLATTLLGDRVRVESLAVENGRVVVGMLQHGPDDPMARPTQLATRTFELRVDRLTETSDRSVEAEGRPPDLIGTIWEWRQTLMGNDDRFVPDHPSDYTLRLSPDGTLSVQADCNRVGGTYRVDGNHLTVQLGPSTMAACPEGSLGNRFVNNLAGANSFFFDEDDLLIDLVYDSGTMRFSPQGGDPTGSG
jgi:heat shock protein HslJ